MDFGKALTKIFKDKERQNEKPLVKNPPPKKIK